MAVTASPHATIHAVWKIERARLIAQFELGLTQPDWALGYRFDVVLRGAHATPVEAA